MLRGFNGKFIRNIHFEGDHKSGLMTDHLKVNATILL